MLRRGLGGEQHPIDAFSANFVNSMLHLYRSEVATMVSYRVRLDTSTNWAISITAMLTVFGLGTTLRDTFFLYLFWLVIMFLVVEASRYSVFAFTRNRVLMLEQGFFAHTVLSHVSALPSSESAMMCPAGFGWEEALKLMLLAPPDHIQRVTWPAVYMRLTRHYVYLIFAIYFAWLFKIGREPMTQLVWARFGVVSSLLFLGTVLVAVFRPGDGPLMEAQKLWAFATPPRGSMALTHLPRHR